MTHQSESSHQHEAVFEKVKQLPLCPGVYQFFDSDKRLLYIGKATQLRSRVQSYFRESTQLSGLKQFMVHQIADVKTILVDNEPEALLLETTLIKKHKPPYNVVMKDDKNFQYIHISEEPFPRISTVRQIYTKDDRGRYARKPGKYFGPYTSGYAVKQVLLLLKTIFRYCESAPIFKHGEVQYPKRPCLDYHLGRCVGPCAHDIGLKEYQHIFEKIQRFLQGEYEPVKQSLERQMHNAAREEQFELAARLRDQMTAIDRLMEEQKVVSTTRENADYLSLARLNGTAFSGVAAVNLFMVRKGKMVHQDVFLLHHTKDQSDEEVMSAFRDQYYAQTVNKIPRVYMSTEKRRGRNRKLLEMGHTNAEQELQRYTATFDKRKRQANEGLQELGTVLQQVLKNDAVGPGALHRIEIYDISNIQGNYTVGSMVVFTDGMPDPSQYRRFKIKSVLGPDDFASLREVIDRRVHRLPGRRKGVHAKKKRSIEAWPRPDLIIIDGGKGQLSAVQFVLNVYQLDIPIISLAKREEEIFIPDRSTPIHLKKDSEGLYFVQRMRDEAHRFAIGFYRKRHLKGLV